MSNPVIDGDSAVQPFASAVLTVPAIAVASKKGLSAGIDRMRAEAKRDGLEEGRTAGFSAGHAEGFTAGEREGFASAQAQLQCEREERLVVLATRCKEIDDAWKAWIVASEEALTSRVMEAVRAVTNAELQLGREGVLAIVRSCLAEVTHARDLTIRVNAVDVPTLEAARESLERESEADGPLVIVADASIAEGAIIESSAGRVDGTIVTRLELLQQSWDETQELAA